MIHKLLAYLVFTYSFFNTTKKIVYIRVIILNETKNSLIF